MLRLDKHAARHEAASGRAAGRLPCRGERRAIVSDTRVRFDRLDPAPFSLDIGTTERLVLNMNGGNSAP